MALPTTEIFLRSPYWVTTTETDLDYVLCELRVWTGDLSAEPAYPDVKLRSTGLNDTTSIDIAEFARDYVEVTFGGVADSNAVFISYQLYIYAAGQSTDPTPETRVYLTGLDGYGTFQDGVNFQWSNQVMISDNIVTAYHESSVRIPVLQNNFTGYKLQRYAAGWGDQNNLSTFRTVTGLTPVENTSDIINYIQSSYIGQYADRIIFEFSGSSDETVDIFYSDCSKYGNTKVHFVNRLGCTQEIHFKGRFDVSMKSKGSQYKRNLLSNGSYNNTRHQDYTLNRNGNIKMSLNTGWVNESENDTFIEMMMSEQVWIQVDSSKLGVGWIPKQSSLWTVPVTVKSNSSEIKNKVNDKLINYSFEFEAAHDWINTVR